MQQWQRLRGDVAGWRSESGRLRGGERDRRLLLLALLPSPPPLPPPPGDGVAVTCVIGQDFPREGEGERGRCFVTGWRIEGEEKKELVSSFVYSTTVQAAHRRPCQSVRYRYMFFPKTKLHVLAE